MKKLKVLLVLILTSAICLFGFIFNFLSSPPPEYVNEGENALAMKDVVILGHVNNERVRHLLGNATLDPKSLDLPVLSTDVFDELYNGESNFKDSVGHFIFSANAGEKPATSIMLYGDFEWSKTQSSIDNFFIIETLSNDSYKLTKREDNSVFMCPDELAKQVKQELYLYFSEQWIVMTTDNKRLGLIVNRLHDKSSSDIELSSWRQYRDTKTLSAGVIVPKDTSKTSNGMSAHIMNKIMSENEEVSALFFGVDINILSQTISIDSQIDANTVWVDEKYLSANKLIIESKLDASKISETLASFFNNINIENDNDSLIATLTLSEADIPKLSDVWSELVIKVFSGFSSNANLQSTPQKISTESLMTSQWNYNNNNEFIALPGYKEGEFDAKPSFVNGPLAVSVNSVNVNEELNLTELSIEGFMNIPNVEGWWHQSKANLTLKIHSVNDDAGNNLLRDERCVKDLGFRDGNHVESSGFSTTNLKAYIDKTLRLSQGSKFSDITNIKGTVSFSAPVNIDIIDLPLQKEASFERHGFRFFINEFDRQSVSYEVSGSQKHLLEVQGLNAKAEALSQSYSWGSGDVKTQHFQGDVKSIRLIISKAFSEHEANFTVEQKDFFPKTELNVNYLTTRPPVVDKNNWASAIQQKWRVNNAKKFLEKEKYLSRHKVGDFYQFPFAMMLSHDNTQSWVNPPSLKMISPFVSGLTFNLQAIELTANSGNENLAYYVKNNVWYRINASNITEYIPQKVIDESAVLDATVNIGLKLKAKEPIGKLSGEVKVNLPISIETINVGLPDFEQTLHKHDVLLSRVKITNGKIPRTTYRIEAPNLINMIAVLKNGKEIRPEQGSVFKDGFWLLSYPLTDQIDHFEVLVASKVNTLKFPYEITPNYNR